MPWEQSATSPYLLMVRFVSQAAGPESVKAPPEKTSWKISMKGMTVIAVVVVCTTEEMNSDVMSDA